jgi:2-polyprenyl-3-methyl-5-hydroxy-6-metoxy-1,4-benzoquinol methylase
MEFADVPLEDVRSYWDRRPCNIRHSPQPVGSVEYFNEVEARKYFVEPHIPGFAQFPLWAGKRVLEIGCGIGSDTINFARAGALVTAVDLSPASLAVARQRAEAFGVSDRITFYNANAEELSATVPLDEPYDLIYSFGVLHHTPHPERAFEQLRRYGRPGTIVKVMVYNRHSWKVLDILVSEGKGKLWRLDEIIARHSEAQTGCPVTYSYSKASLRDLLDHHGIEPGEVFADHIFCWSIPEYRRYEYKMVWYFRMLPKPVFRALERLLGWHLCISGTMR